MKQKLPLLALGVLATVLCSCAATSVKQTWKSPEAKAPAGKVAVLAIADRGLLRQGFENRFVQQLTRGAGAITTFDQLSLVQIKDDKRGAAERLKAGGAEALLIVRLVNLSSSYRETTPGNARFAPVITGFETMPWYDYYSVGFVNMSATYSSVKDQLFLETSLYDLKTEKLQWSALTETVLTENMDRIAEMDPLIARIVAAMRKDGVVP